MVRWGVSISTVERIPNVTAKVGKSHHRVYHGNLRPLFDKVRRHSSARNVCKEYEEMSGMVCRMQYLNKYQSQI